MDKDETYEAAMQCLNSRKSKAQQTLEDMRGSDDMGKWLEKIGYRSSDLDALNAIHVAGTNGKGSVCKFTASILNVYSRSLEHPIRIGMYTSPHVRHVRERICIDGEPISEKLFARYFFEVWNRLPPLSTSELDVPRYLQLLALVSFHVFIKERVDVAIYETHMGGKFDATNVLHRPVVTGITSIAMDHVAFLGPLLQDIASHKAGIFKFGSMALSTLQEAGVMSVLRKESADVGAPFEVVDIDPMLPSDTKILQPEVQRQNFSLAMKMADAWVRAKLQTEPPTVRVYEELRNSANDFLLPGRFQQIIKPKCEWNLDGAHNEAGIEQAVNWYADGQPQGLLSEGAAPIRILLFAQFSSRNVEDIMGLISRRSSDRGIAFDHVIMTTYKERSNGEARIDRNKDNHGSATQVEQYCQYWRTLNPKAIVTSTSTIESAVEKVIKLCLDQVTGGQVFVTGSLHLVSGVLCQLDSHTAEHYKSTISAH